MTSTGDTPETVGSTDWLTIDQAAEALGVSAKTVRRRIKTGTLTAEKRHAPEVGGDRWYIDAGSLPTPAGGVGLVPADTVREITDLYRELVEATARAEKAETIAEFERERRKEAQDAAEALRAELEAARARRWWQRRQK